MKKLFTLVFSLVATFASAQDGPNHAIPIFGGPGFIGFRAAGPCPVGQALTWLNISSDPICTAVDAVSVMTYGAVGDNITDDTTAIQTAINAGKSLFFPCGTYKISATITISTPVDLYGAGQKCTVIRQSSTTQNVIFFNYASLLKGGGIHNISIEAGSGWLTSGFQGTGTTGVCLAIFNPLTNFVVENINIANCALGITIDSSNGNGGVFGVFIQNFHILYFQDFGIRIGSSGDAGGQRWITNGQISNNGFTGTNTASVGMRWLQSGGDYTSSVDVTSSNEGIVVAPASGKSITYLFFYGVLADTTTSNAWTFDGTNGNVFSTVCINCWGAFSTNGAGLRTLGVGLDGLSWVGGRLRENGTNGWKHDGGVNIQIDSTQIAQNSKLASNTSAGIQVAANVSQWAVTNSRIGNFASSLGSTQADGINIAAGTGDNFRIVDNDLRGFGAGKSPLTNGGTGNSIVLLGNLPLQTAGVNREAGQPLTFASVGTIGAGATQFLGVNGAQAVETDSMAVITRTGVISQLIAQATVAPGAGQTFIYTVRVNGIDTGLTGTITGAASFQVISTIPGIQVNAADDVTVKIVTSGGAGVSRHRVAISIAP